jgi:hypothetical protein
MSDNLNGGNMMVLDSEYNESQINFRGATKTPMIPNIRHRICVPGIAIKDGSVCDCMG